GRGSGRITKANISTVNDSQREDAQGARCSVANDPRRRGDVIGNLFAPPASNGEQRKRDCPTRSQVMKSRLHALVPPFETTERDLELARPARAEVEAAIRTVIRWTGDDPQRDGLIDTPARVARAFQEFFAGYGEDPALILQRTF